MKVVCHEESREKTVNESWEYEMSNSLKTYQTQVQLASTSWQTKIQKLIGVAKDDLNLALIDDNSLSLSFSPASEITITSKAVKLNFALRNTSISCTPRRYWDMDLFCFSPTLIFTRRVSGISLWNQVTETGYWDQSRTRAWPGINLKNGESLWSPLTRSRRIDLIWCVHNYDGLSLVNIF